MNFLERIPTRWLLAGAALACLALWAAPSSAQTTGDAALGKTLFEDTPNAAPDANLTHACMNCHGKRAGSAQEDLRRHQRGRRVR
jgi:cytochrome c553